MPIPKELKGYATSIGFPSSETLAKIFALLYDEEDDLSRAEIVYGVPDPLDEEETPTVEDLEDEEDIDPKTETVYGIPAIRDEDIDQEEDNDERDDENV